jgi:hypothetical protein
MLPISRVDARTPDINLPQIRGAYSVEPNVHWRHVPDVIAIFADGTVG